MESNKENKDSIAKALKEKLLDHVSAVKIILACIVACHVFFRLLVTFMYFTFITEIKERHCSEVRKSLEMQKKEILVGINEKLSKASESKDAQMVALRERLCLHVCIHPLHIIYFALLLF